VAHRLSTIADADLIVVLRDGCVAEAGTHNALLDIEGGLYAELWSKQAARGGGGGGGTGGGGNGAGSEASGSVRGVGSVASLTELEARAAAGAAAATAAGGGGGGRAAGAAQQPRQ
jgi:hypothetical protein